MSRISKTARRATPHALPLWKAAIRQVWKPALRHAGATAMLFALLANVAHAQNSQFVFDPIGNLLVQTAAITAPPQILSQPQNQVIGPSDYASFSVVAADTRGLTYQWLFNGMTVSGATDDALLLANVGEINQGSYSVRLVNSSGSVTSAPAALMLDADGDGLGDSWEETYFGGLAQYPTADPDGDGLSNREEFLQGTNPTEKASAMYRLTLLSDAGQVTLSPNRLWFTNGESVTLSATAFAPDAFHAWAGDIYTTNNPITITITNHTTIIAYLGSYNIAWNRVTGGDWFDASNWNPPILPLANDNVLIDRSVNVTLNSNAVCRGLTLGSPSVAAVLSGTGDLTLRGDSFWVQGTMSGSGRTIIAADATLHLDNVNGAMLTGRTLENAGTIVWTGTTLGLSGAILTNRPGALFEVQTPAAISFPGVGSRFDNAGTLRKASPATNLISGIALNNYGTVEVQMGMLTLQSGGVNEGTIHVHTGATLNLASGVFAAGPSSAITGAGSFTVSGATATLAGLLNPGGPHLFSGGIANLNGPYFGTNNPVTISGGTVNLNTTSAVPVVQFNSGTIGGTGVLTILEELNWLAGTMNGGGRTVIAPAATLNLFNGAAVTLFARTLENGGTAIWTGAGDLGVNASVITNRAGAVFEVRNSAAFSYQGGTGSRFDNAGTFRKTNSAGTNTFVGGFSFNNYGTVEIQTGTILCGAPVANFGSVTLSPGTRFGLAGGGTAGGSFNLPATALMEWTAGTFVLNPGAQLNGVGLYTINGATLTFNTDGAVDKLDVNGTLNGTGITAVNSSMNWAGGSMGGTGRTVIAPEATLNLNNPGTLQLGRILENAGTTLWTGGNVALGNAVITNRVGAVFHAQNAASLTFQAGANRFDNAGTVRKSVNSGTMSLVNGVNFNNYGTVDIRNGIVAVPVYFSMPGALLNCVLGGTAAGTGFGQLQVSGALTLNGSLTVELGNGFMPALNDAFTVLTAGTRTGVFASFQYPSNAVTMQLSNTPNSVVVQVTGVSGVPAPRLLAPQISGSNVQLTWTAVSNTAYRLEFSPSLNPPDWSASSGDVLAVSNIASKLDPLNPTNRFYRVRVLP